MSVVTPNGGVTFPWPPINGRRRVPMEKTAFVESSPARVSDSRKRTFPEARADDVEARRCAGERRVLRESLQAIAYRAEGTQQENLRAPEDAPPFAFLAHSGWRPSGGKAAPIPPPPPSPRQILTDLPKVTEVNERLLKPPHRKEWKEPVVEKKVVDVEKLVKHFTDDVKQREVKHQVLINKCAARHDHAKPPPPPLKPDDIEGFVERHVTNPMHRQQIKHDQLLRKFAPAPPPRRLDAEAQRASTARLYTAGVERERDAIARACKKYLDDRSPRATPRTREQWAETAERLHVRKTAAP